MTDSISRRIRTVWFLLLAAVAVVANGGASAAVPVTDYVVIQPIDVCGTAGPTAGCAPFNLVSRSPNPSLATATTPIGFVDSTTNVNLTRAMWLQAGVDVTFLPVVEYNNSNYQSIGDIICSPSATNCASVSSVKFRDLSSGTAAKATGCTLNCTVPLANPTTNAINMFFVNSLTIATGGLLAGFSWLNGNGIAIAGNVFSFSPLVPSRFDTPAHELGHNFNLDHTTFGAGTVCSTLSPGGCNLMTNGTVRVIPSSTGCSATTKPDFGALFDLDTGLCGTSVPSLALADNLILGTASTVQQGQVQLSGFLNPIPNVNATAGGGVAAGAAPLAVLASTTSTTSTMRKPAGGGDILFTIDYPVQTTPQRPGEYIFALILELPKGFQFGNNLFFQVPTANPPIVVSPVEPLFGKQHAGDKNCRRSVEDDDYPNSTSVTDDAASIECLEINFAPGTFVAGTTVSFTSSIVKSLNMKPATPADLTCTPPSKRRCMDLTFAFSDLLVVTSAFTGSGPTITANSQFPNPGVKSFIANPADFPTVANLATPLTLTGFTQTPCTPTMVMEYDDYYGWEEVPVCPPLAHGDPSGPD